MENIYVTKTFLPPLDEYIEYLREIWATGSVTNDGPMFQRFEQTLAEFTGQRHLVCLGNGTWALQLAVRACDLVGEVITTPFTHVASSGSLVWEGCTPVYCDIQEDTMNIDPDKIEPLINNKTTGILAVHVYSNPCNIDRINQIAQNHGLRVIYDAAHAFGACYKGQSVFAFGDLTMASFNATKGFHTVEGGALFARNDEMVARIRRLAYFGMDPSRKIVQQFGTNAKLIEFCAAMGLLNIKYFEAAVRIRQNRYEQYQNNLSVNTKIKFQKLDGEINYSYMPVVLESETYKARVIAILGENGIIPREYFNPSLETVFKASVHCPVALDLSQRVLCLPMSDYLTAEQVDRICGLINIA